MTSAKEAVSEKVKEAEYFAQRLTLAEAEYRRLLDPRLPEDQQPAAIAVRLSFVFNLSAFLNATYSVQEITEQHGSNAKAWVAQEQQKYDSIWPCRLVRNANVHRQLIATGRLFRAFAFDDLSRPQRSHFWSRFRFWAKKPYEKPPFHFIFNRAELVQYPNIVKQAGAVDWLTGPQNDPTPIVDLANQHLGEIRIFVSSAVKNGIL